MNIRLITTCLFLVTHLAFCSGESKIAFDTVTLGLSEHKMEIKTTLLKEGKFDFQVKLSDKIIKISPEFLFDAKDINSESIRIITVSNPGVPTNLTAGFIVSFVVGGTSEHGKDVKGEEVTVCSVIRLHFENGEFRKSVMAIPSGDFKNKWHFLRRVRSADGGVVDETDKDDIVSSVRCPWYTSVEPDY